jgi:hypothetical protein
VYVGVETAVRSALTVALPACLAAWQALLVSVVGATEGQPWGATAAVAATAG